MFVSIGSPAGIAPQSRQQTGFKAGYVFKKTDPILPKLTVLNNALVKNEYKDYRYFCFFPYNCDVRGKQKAFQQHAEKQMRKLGVKPDKDVKVDTRDGEMLTFAVEKKIDELVAKAKKLVGRGNIVSKPASSRKKPTSPPQGKPVHKPTTPRRSSKHPTNIKRAFSNWLLA
jgi:hypothetical protein